MRHRRALAPLAVVLALLAPAADAGAAVGNPPHGAPVYTRANPRDAAFPDPEIVRDGGTYWAFGTDGPLGEVQRLSSTDLVTWTPRGDALGSAPSWGANNDVWAPAVAAFFPNWHVFASFVKPNGRRCIGLATSSSISGTFTPVHEFQHCNDPEGGVIDPALVTVGGTAYLLWKTEGVIDSVAPAIWSQPLAPDGRALTGSPTRILSSSQPWEDSLIENPSMAEVDGRLYLFFSGNHYQSAAYATGWSVCSSPQGPCVTPPNRTILRTESETLKGPGGASAFRDENGDWWLAFHAWTTGGTTDATGTRQFFLRRLRFVQGRPVLQSADGSFTPPPLAERVAGASRYATAAAYSAYTVQAFRPVTYVATGADFADALSAAPASGAEDSPVLLVQRDNLPGEVDTELRRLRPGHIVVMGGQGAISTTVENQLRGYAPGLHREAGVNRYHTAALVCRNTFKTLGGTVYVATGEAFPDALAAGAVGAANRSPLLLVQRDAIPPDTRDELQRLRPSRIVVIGGVSAVSDGTLAQLRALAGNVVRIAGADRYETAALVAEQEFARPVGGLVVATGSSFADAVAAGAAGYPILLVPGGDAPAPARVRQALDEVAPLGVVVVGGEAAVGPGALASLGL